MPRSPREGGLPSTVWAGPERRSGIGRPAIDCRPGPGRPGPRSLRLGFAGDDLGYAVDFGHPVAAAGPPCSGSTRRSNGSGCGRPGAAAFGATGRPAQQRRPASGPDGQWTVVTQGLRTFDSMLTEIADPRAAPELFVDPGATAIVAVLRPPADRRRRPGQGKSHRHQDTGSRGPTAVIWRQRCRRSGRSGTPTPCDDAIDRPFPGRRSDRVARPDVSNSPCGRTV